MQEYLRYTDAGPFDCREIISEMKTLNGLNVKVKIVTKFIIGGDINPFWDHAKYNVFINKQTLEPYISIRL